jgi:hypothetical protein
LPPNAPGQWGDSSGSPFPISLKPLGALPFEMRAKTPDIQFFIAASIQKVNANGYFF